MTDYQKEDPGSIQTMFDRIAANYDRANALMSLSLHKRWNRELTKKILSRGAPKKYLDLCSGTGEIARTLLGSLDSPCEAFLLDFSAQMLECARLKIGSLEEQDHHVHYLHADAQEIPLPGDSIEAVTIAYGIRNVKDPAACAAEAFRVLKSEGIFAILELTQPKNSLMKVGHKAYMKAMLPLVGQMVSKDKEAYKYLCRSIQEFIPPEDLEDILIQAGFLETSIYSLGGGIATIITGVKS